MKRFTETTKWDDAWFRRLSPSSKCFWQYICDRCDNAGYWKADLELASFYIGIVPDENILNEINEGKERVHVKGDYWVINDFVEFQYGRLSEKNPLHQNVQALLQRHRRERVGPTQALRRPIGKGIGTGMELVEEGVKEKDILEVYNLYPPTRAGGGPTLKSAEDKKRIKEILEQGIDLMGLVELYLRKTDPDYILNFSRFLSELPDREELEKADDW